ncbi:GNAT family N-acetyltransferase [Phenylobacterium aquaticum]|uniref:GNAT family N-acetyltransferase n=1 Tax=Phenylobacterium aquaticum TaxID=1763816 RepID=UPI0026EB7C82|nr:GNAT family N-acetyltransferase [Phenylobacterium aquaticum]
MIETDRLILRGIHSEADREQLALVNGDPRVGAWLAGTLDRAGSDAMADRINAHIAEHGFGFWAAELKAERRIVGLIGLMVVKPDALPVGPAIEMGWRLAPETWGTGLASEGAAAARDWAFAHLATDELIAFTARGNLASQAVMRKIGMTPDPTRDFDHPKLAPDHPLRAHVVYAIAR